MKNFFLTVFSILFVFIIIELFLYIEDYHPEYKRYNFIINDTLNIVNDDPNDFFKDTKENKTVFLVIVSL